MSTQITKLIEISHLANAHGCCGCSCSCADSTGTTAAAAAVVYVVGAATAVVYAVAAEVVPTALLPLQLLSFTLILQLLCSSQLCHSCYRYIYGWCIFRIVAAAGAADAAEPH